MRLSTTNLSIAGVSNVYSFLSSSLNRWTQTIFLEKIKVDCPWFLQMHALIGERLNLVPVGLGNSGTTVNLSILADTATSSDMENLATAVLDDQAADLQSSECEVPGNTDDWITTSADEDRESSPAPDSKPQVPPPKKDPKRKAETTPAPVASRANRPTKKSKLEDFASAAVAEEQTRQKELDITCAKVESNAKITVAREQAKAKASEMKMQLCLEKLRMRHELKMAKLAQSAPPPIPPPAPPVTSAPMFNFSSLSNSHNIQDDYNDTYSTTSNTYLPMPGSSNL